MTAISITAIPRRRDSSTLGAAMVGAVESQSSSRANTFKFDLVQKAKTWELVPSAGKILERFSRPAQPTPLTLAELADKCDRLFNQCQEHRALADWDWIHLMAGKFHGWNLGIRASKTDKSSLDYRVRDRPDVRDQIAELLETLALSLTKCLDLGKSAFLNAK
jgi:hypothetical protein